MEAPVVRAMLRFAPASVMPRFSLLCAVSTTGVLPPPPVALSRLMSKSSGASSSSSVSALTLISPLVSPAAIVRVPVMAFVPAVESTPVPLALRSSGSAGSDPLPAMRKFTTRFAVGSPPTTVTLNFAGASPSVISPLSPSLRARRMLSDSSSWMVRVAVAPSAEGGAITPAPLSAVLAAPSAITTVSSCSLNSSPLTVTTICCVSGAPAKVSGLALIV